MENMILSYTNEKFGKIRLVVFERGILFCANDIARCLGFANPWSAVRNHCGDKVLHPHISGNGTKVMNFITTSGVAALAMHSRNSDKDDFMDWLVQQVIPSAISDTRIFFRKPEEADLYLPDDDEQFVIRFGDYFRHVSHEQELMSMVTEFIDAVSLLPDCKPMEDLKEWAEAAEEYLEDLIEEKCPVLNTIIDDDIKGYAEMMKRELITPEKAGFCLCKSMSEEKEPIEHDTEDEKSIYDLTALLTEAKDVQGRIGSFAAELEDILDMIAQFDALEKSCHEDA